MDFHRKTVVIAIAVFALVLIGAGLAWGISTGRISFKANTNETGLGTPIQKTDAELLADIEQQTDALSTSLLTDLGSYTDLGEQERLTLVSRMVETATAREKLLENLVTTDSSPVSAEGINEPTRLAFKLAFPEDIQQQFSVLPAVKTHIESTTRSLSGALDVVIADNWESKSSRTEYTLRLSDNTTRNLKFLMTDPPLTSGDQVTVKEGLAVSQNGVVAIRGENANDLQSYLTVTKRSDVAISRESVPDLPGVKVASAVDVSIGVILFNYKNSPLQPVTQAKVRSTYFDGAKSVAAYYREVSGSQMTIHGDVLGWYTINSNAPTPCTNTTTVNNGLEALAMARADSGRTPPEYDYYAFVFPKGSSCPFDGFANFNRTFIATTSSDQNNVNYFRVPAHELGHNFGLKHASGYYCPDAQHQFSFYPYDERGQCVVNEYYDEDDIMGNSIHSLNAIYKIQLGWLPLSRVQTVIQNGSYILSPINRANNGIQALKLPNTTNGPTYIEYRRPSGVFDDYPPDWPSVNGVLIRRLVGGRSIVLNASSPSNMYQAALALNKTLNLVSSGVAITTKNLSDGSASVEITYTDRTSCVPRSFVQTVTPPSATVSRRFDTKKDYQVSISNTNIGTCQSSLLTPTVTFATADRNYLSKTVTPSSLTLPIGQTGTTVVSIRAQANTPIGRHDVKISVIDPRNPSVTIATTVSYWVTQ